MALGMSALSQAATSLRLCCPTTVPKADPRAKIERCCYKTGMKRLTAIVALTLAPFAAAAQSTGVLATRRPITWGMIFALLFLMLGPIKLLGPFAAATKDCDRVFCLRLATRAFLFSVAAVTIAGEFVISLPLFPVYLAPPAREINTGRLASGKWIGAGAGPRRYVRSTKGEKARRAPRG